MSDGSFNQASAFNITVELEFLISESLHFSPVKLTTLDSIINCRLKSLLRFSSGWRFALTSANRQPRCTIGVSCELRHPAGSPRR